MNEQEALAKTIEFPNKFDAAFSKGWHAALQQQEVQPSDLIARATKLAHADWINVSIRNLQEVLRELLAAPIAPTVEREGEATEVALLRAVYEEARKMLRFDGIEHKRAMEAWEAMDAAIEQVKEFDGGTYEPATLTAPVRQPDDEQDAKRWRMLLAFFEEYQIDAMKLYCDIDAALHQSEVGKP